MNREGAQRQPQYRQYASIAARVLRAFGAAILSQPRRASTRNFAAGLLSSARLKSLQIRHFDRHRIGGSASRSGHRLH
jgi:hypothetical protein